MSFEHVIQMNKTAEKVLSPKKSYHPKSGPMLAAGHGMTNATRNIALSPVSKQLSK